MSASALGSQWVREQPYKVLWDTADLSEYQSTCDNLLGNIDLPLEALLCQIHNNRAHHYQFLNFLNRYCQQNADCLQEAANVCVPCIKVGVEKHW